MRKATYGMWWWEMIKKWWFYFGVVGMIQAIWWFVPKEAVDKYESWVRWVQAMVIIVPWFVWIPYQVWRQAHPEIVKDQQRNPNAYVAAHICSIDYLPLEMARRGVGSDKFVHLAICFCNALFHGIELTSLSGTAQINDDKTEKASFTEQKAVKINPGFTSLPKCQLTATRELEMSLGTFSKPTVRIDLRLLGYDKKNTKYEWSATYGDNNDAR